MVFYSRPPKERKIKQFTWESSKQVKKKEKSFWVFILISTTSMEIKLTIFFDFSQGLSNTQEEN